MFIFVFVFVIAEEVGVDQKQYEEARSVWTMEDTAAGALPELQLQLQLRHEEERQHACVLKWTVLQVDHVAACSKVSSRGDASCVGLV